MYIANCSYSIPANGLQVMDISDPRNPIPIAFSLSGIFTRDVDSHGRYIYLTDDNCLVAVFDLYYDQLKVEKTATCGSTTPCTQVRSGDEITYTTKVSNPTPYSLTNLNLTDPIPANTTYIPGSATNNGQVNGTNIVWNLGIIPAKTGTDDPAIQVSFRVRVN